MTKDWTLRRFNYDDLPRVAEFRKSFPESSLVRCDEPEYHKWKCDDKKYLEWRYVLALNRYLTLIARSKEGKSQAIL